MNRKDTFFLTAGLLAGAVLAVLIYITDIPLLRQITPLVSLFIAAFAIIRAFRKNEK